MRVVTPRPEAPAAAVITQVLPVIAPIATSVSTVIAAVAAPVKASADQALSTDPIAQ